jgi:gas vesicle protein
MSDLDKDSKHLLIGALLGGALGVGLTAMFFASRRRHSEEKSPLGISHALEQVEEVLKQCHADDAQSKVHQIGKKAEKMEHTLFDIVDWASAGISLWKKLKK